MTNLEAKHLIKHLVKFNYSNFRWRFRKTNQLCPAKRSPISDGVDIDIIAWTPSGISRTFYTEDYLDMWKGKLYHNRTHLDKLIIPKRRITNATTNEKTS